METLKHNKRTNFDYPRFIEALKAHARTLPPINTDLTLVGRIARETGIDRVVLKHMFNSRVIRSFETVLRLAGWAGLYLDEFRRE